MLFLIFGKGISKRNYARFFKIRKYSFLTFEKEINKKALPDILRFVIILF